MAKKNNYDFSSLGSLIEKNKEKNKEIGMELKLKSEENKDIETNKIVDNQSEKMSLENKENDKVDALKKEEKKKEISQQIKDNSVEIPIEKKRRGRPPGNSNKPNKINSSYSTTNSVLDEMFKASDDKKQVTVYFDQDILDTIDKYVFAYRVRSRSEFIATIVEKTMLSFPKL